MRAATAALIVLAVAAPAAAREVRTGGTVELPAAHGSRYSAIYWVEPRGDGDVAIVALPSPAEVGDTLDVVDEDGFVARVRVVSVERAVCGILTYARARADVAWPGLPRRLAGAAVALGPARGKPSRSRVLRPAETPAQRGRMLIDVDGDGEPDLARQLLLECGAERGRPLACLETWSREGGVWRRLARAEIGPCG